ncbi:MAG: hypothetical protein P4L76_04040 [Beijerinckiaceae bacterium]|nr:hypothetical protein [Beijerinckiaceae bacterium]
MRLPALTVWQPWASLIAIGAKPYEFRRWSAPRAYRGKRIAVHAGARPIRKEELRDLILRLRDEGAMGTALVVEPALELLDRVLTSPGILPLSHVVCTAILGVPERATELVPAGLADSDRIDHSIWAWPLTAIQHLEPPRPAKGAQGFWTWHGGDSA